VQCDLARSHLAVLIRYEQIGAGLQITPNASRLLKEWGLEAEVDRLGAEPTRLTVHRYADGKVLAHEDDFHEQMRSKYGAPFVDMHRVDLQKMLFNRAIELGVSIRLGSRVATVKQDVSRPEIHLESGNTIQCDLVVGADGLWSRCRESLLGQKDSPLPTGDLAYRIVLELDKLKDPELREWVEKPACHFWVGPKAHAVAYSLRGGQMYNIVLLCPDDLPEDVARQAGSTQEMKELFAGWDPILTRFLDQVESVDKWRLMHRAEVESYSNEAGNFLLIGDSCHPMLPYLAQGANSSLEDGAVLGRILSHVTEKSQLRQAVKLYESVRKARSEGIVKETFHQRNAFHMPDGPAQEDRDALFASQLGRPVSVKFPSRW